MHDVVRLNDPTPNQFYCQLSDGPVILSKKASPITRRGFLLTTVFWLPTTQPQPSIYPSS